jgi:protein SCO1/2
MRRLITVIVIAFCLGAVIGLGVLIATQPTGPKTQTSGTALIGGPFTLTNQDGKRVTEKDFKGKHSLVFFGFTHCPDICPAELQVISEALDQLGDKADEVTPIFVTVDPARDTPEALKTYLSNFGDQFVGLTGSEEEIAKVAKEYRVVYKVHKEDGDAENYNVDHSAIVYLMGPDGSYVEHYSYGTGADEMAESLKRYL